MINHPFPQARQAGFTLIEAVIVIVIIGVLGAVVAVFIRMPLQGYQDSVARAELTDLADLTLRRVSRDLRLALPNSIVVNADGTAISFFVTKTGGRYLSADDDVPGVPVLDFVTANTTFAMVGSEPVGKQAILPDVDYIVVNNLGVDPADAYTGGNRAQVKKFDVLDAARNLYRVTVHTNPFAGQSPSMPSPGARFQVVGQPVTYRCTTGAGGTGSLTRQTGYGFTKGAPAADAGTVSLLTMRVRSCRFGYTDLASRSALANIMLELEMPGDAGRIKLVHQVHVDNTP
ncbi:MAG: prepilin-type N-terminal cleavage/methylation domain-containing protein [Telluria sp.]